MNVRSYSLYCHLFLDKSKGIYKTLKLSFPDLSINIDALRLKLQDLITELNKVSRYTSIRLKITPLNIDSVISLKQFILKPFLTKRD